MNDRRQRIDGGALVGGLLLIGLGSLFLLDRLHVADFGDLVGTYWPLIIVVIGVPKLFHPRTVWSGLWLMAIGVWLQAVRLHWYDLTYGNSWPLLLIALGAGMVLRTFFESTARREGDVPREGRHGS